MEGLGLRVVVDGRTVDVPPDGHADIGRSDVCAIQVEDKRVSRVHAVVWPTPEGWRFADRDSPRGSWVDGRRVDQQLITEPTVLWLGDPEGGIPISFEPRVASAGEATPPDPPAPTVAVESSKRRRLCRGHLPG
jgi:pSer/pThr/pTyr-binding forkhead associated (FHA) protein